MRKTVLPIKERQDSTEICKCGVVYRSAFERLFTPDRSGKSTLQDQQGQNKGVV